MDAKPRSEKLEDDASAEHRRLRQENIRLTRLLQAHGIDWRSGLPEPSDSPSPTADGAPAETSLSVSEKIALFRRLFRGRIDVYPTRWENKAGKSGYSPACANEWRPGVCEKPRIKCADCSNRSLLPVSDQVIYDHLAGHHTIGVYPLLPDDTCHFLAVDFDDAEWQDDARAFMQSCREFEIPAALEISRSGKGAHAWIFFSSALQPAMPAASARR